MVVIVTGASRGVGAAVARWLGTCGAGVTLVARSADALAEVEADVERFGGEALMLPADVSDRAACGQVVTKTIERFGRLDALVNNAALLTPIAPLAEVDPEAWQYTVAVNLVGPFYLMQAVLEALRASGGRIVNVSTGVATSPRSTWSAYCASKAGLLHLTRVVALEESDITIVAVRPGAVDTQMQLDILEARHNMKTAEQKQRVHRLRRTGHLEPPEVPGRSIAWLAVYAPHSWHGEEIDYNDPRVVTPARALFGERFIQTRDDTS